MSYAASQQNTTPIENTTLRNTGGEKTSAILPATTEQHVTTEEQEAIMPTITTPPPPTTTTTTTTTSHQIQPSSTLYQGKELTASTHHTPEASTESLITSSPTDKPSGAMVSSDISLHSMLAHTTSVTDTTSNDPGKCIDKRI